MGENIAEGKFATAAVDAADAFMGLSGATFGAKKIREGKVDFIAPTAKKVAYQVADKLKAPRTAQAKAPEPVRLSSTTAEPVAPCTGPTCSGGQCFVTGTLVDTPDGLVPIESLRVGDRVVAHDACVDAEITDAWRILSLRLDDARGPAFAIEVDTLVPPELAAEAEANGRHPLVLSELGVRGLADVLDIREPPPLTSGPGCLVRSTITSWSARVLTLRFAETAEVLEPTEGHPLYRLEDDAWVRAGHLRVGDHLRTAGGFVTITHIEAQAAFRRVHNLEVDQQHTYRVLAAGLIAHNTCDFVELRRTARGNAVHLVTSSPLFPRLRG
jgi:hypothetical protein